MPAPIPAIKTKTLSAADAQRLYIARFRPSYPVSAKFSDDHVVAAPNLSKSTSIDAAVWKWRQVRPMMEGRHGNR